MKLSKLVSHTSEWFGISKPTVESVAKYLRPAGLLSTGGRGPGGAEMTVDDKINLMLGVCGVEVANRAPEHVRVWRRLVRITTRSAAHEFAFLQSATVRDFFFDLITKDLNGGPLDAWLKEADDALAKVSGQPTIKNHEIALDFYVDEFSFKIAVSRFSVEVDPARFPSLQQSSADTIEVRFLQPLPYGEHEYQMPRLDGYRATSQLIRRLRADNLVGWGTCLTEQLPNEKPRLDRPKGLPKKTTSLPKKAKKRFR